MEEAGSLAVCGGEGVTEDVEMRTDEGKESVLNRERPVENAIPLVLGEAENVE